MAKTLEQYMEECQPIAQAKGYEIVGIVEPFTGQNTKMVNRCKQHGEWRTTTFKNFKRGYGCPSCGLIRRGSKSRDCEEATEIAKALCASAGYTFIRWIDPAQTKAKSLFEYTCGDSSHGLRTSCIDRMQQGHKCNLCMNVYRGEATKNRNIGNAFNFKTDDYHIQKFIETGVFIEGTIFKRSARRNYWLVTCPICSKDEFVKAGLCSGTFESFSVDLKKGNRPCRCSRGYKFTEQQWTYKIKKQCDSKGYVFIGWVNSVGVKSKVKYLCPIHGEQVIQAESFLRGSGCPQCAGHSQQQLYVNVVKDNGIIVALKFGISKDSDRRLNIQNRCNMFFMERICLYDFSTVKQCKAAERAIKKKLKTGILTVRELKDGYTETVSVSDLENLQKIITQYGGKLVYSKEM